nr:MAG TPA: hypothetical protein [Caudoviricetes sp.]
MYFMKIFNISSIDHIVGYMSLYRKGLSWWP